VSNLPTEPSASATDDAPLGASGEGEGSGWLGLEVELQRLTGTAPSVATPPAVAATFDVLCICAELSQQSARVTSVMQVHAFGYLACLLSLFDGRPATAWAYMFSAVPPTVPYAPALQDAVEAATRADLIRPTSGGEPSAQAPQSQRVALTSAGASELDILNALPSLAPRRRYLRAATGTALTFPASAVANSLTGDSQLWRAVELKSTRMLLEPAAMESLHQQFAALSSVVGDAPSDLLVPATVFVSFLDSELDRLLALEDATDDE
jgi:hypothetical protein